jgi:hypothetical protein
MPNLVITGKCQNNCCYCFLGNNKHGELSLSEIKKLLPFIDSFKHETINILGGEPTRHPEFIPILRFLLAAGYTIKIFTNGKIHLDLIHSLRQIQGNFSFCVNRTNPFLDANIQSFYRILGYKIQLGLTFFQVNQPLEHLKNEIEQYNLEKVFRLGIALPIWPTRQNEFLNLNDYGLAANIIFPFVANLIEFGIQPEFDCGFPYCFFSQEQRLFLQKKNISFASNCGVIPDIGPNLSVKPCLPLSFFSMPIHAKSIWSDLEPTLTSTLSRQIARPLFPKCNDCDTLKQKICSSGCLALRLL